MKKLATLVMPYYINPEMLAEHYREWCKYSDYVRNRLDVILVDDGSPTGAAADVPAPEGMDLKVDIFKVDKDIPWNQHGARNLGAHVATTKWLIMTDMDHLIRAGDMHRLIMTLDSCKMNSVFTFNRLDAPDFKPTVRPDGSHKPHVNSFALWRKTYWAVGGYDEDFCGMYGTDSLFRARLFSAHPAQYLKHVALVRYPREVIGDASTTTLERRAENGTTKNATKERRRWKAEQGRADQIVTLNFPWTHVKTLGRLPSSAGSGANEATESATLPITSTSSEQWSHETTNTTTDLSASQTTHED